MKNKEIWKDLKYLKGYQISNYGRIKSLKRKKELILKKRISNNGYFYVNLSYNNKKITIRPHRLVAIYFIDNPDKKNQVNHIDGNKLNNHFSNLEWSTQSENMKHAYKLGLQKMNDSLKSKISIANKGKCFGEKNSQSKLTKENVLDIRKQLSKGVKGVILAKKYNISPKTISKIKLNQRWCNL